MGEFLGVGPLFESIHFWRLAVRLAIDLTFVAILLFGVYDRRNRNREHLFTCIILNVITFIVCFLLRKPTIDLGFALGLFAVFKTLRYRTEPLRARDLSYLFAVIGLAILNAMGFNKKTSLAESLFASAIVIALAAALEAFPLTRYGGRRNILYDNIALLAPGREEELLRDLSLRTGYTVESVAVEHMNLLEERARIVVTFSPNPPPLAAAAPSAPDDGIATAKS